MRHREQKLERILENRNALTLGIVDVFKTHNDPKTFIVKYDTGFHN